AGHDAVGIGGSRKDSAAVDRDAAGLARARYQHERALAQHEDRGLSQKMRGPHRRAGLDRPRALDDRRDVGAGVGHALGVIARLGRTIQPSRRAAGEAFPDLGLGQLAADEDDAAFPLLARLPWALVVAVENHVHALKHKARVVVLERQDALAAQNARPLRLHEVLHPGEELVRVERLVGPERDRLHLFVMIMLQAAVVMVAVAVTMPVAMVMLAILATPLAN